MHRVDIRFNNNPKDRTICYVHFLHTLMPPPVRWLFSNSWSPLQCSAATTRTTAPTAPLWQLDASLPKRGSSRCSAPTFANAAASSRPRRWQVRFLTRRNRLRTGEVGTGATEREKVRWMSGIQLLATHREMKFHPMKRAGSLNKSRIATRNALTRSTILVIQIDQCTQPRARGSSFSKTHLFRHLVHLGTKWPRKTVDSSIENTKSKMKTPTIPFSAFTFDHSVIDHSPMSYTHLLTNALIEDGGSGLAYVY